MVFLQEKWRVENGINGLNGQPGGMCLFITYQYMLELVFIWEGLLPILAVILIWR